jgi:hypothetical protein
MTEEQYLRREYNVGCGIGRLQDWYPEITKALGLARKGRIARLQTLLLELANRTPCARSLLGYSLSMRLRHREAFYRGFLRYKQLSQTQQERPLI